MAANTCCLPTCTGPGAQALLLGCDEKCGSGCCPLWTGLAWYLLVAEVNADSFLQIPLSQTPRVTWGEHESRLGWPREARLWTWVLLRQTLPGPTHLRVLGVDWVGSQGAKER